MTPGAVDWASVGVPLIVAVGAIVALLVDAFWPSGGWRRQGVVAIAALLAAGAWLADTGSHGWLVAGFSWVLLVAALVVVVVAQSLEDDPAMPAGESTFLLLSATAGALTLAAAQDFVTLVVALELLSLPSIALVAMRRDRRGAVSSAWTFFLASATATAVTLMGLSLLYGLTGTLTYDGVHEALRASEAPVRVSAAVVVLVLVGLFFKVGAVPFHLWIPDAYQGASIPVAAFLSVVSKGGAVAALVVVLAHPLVPLQPRWDLFVAIVAALSMTVGNIGALAQRDVVGMLAWSAVAQGGFVLAPMVALAVRADVVLTAPLRYLAVYAMATLTVFAVAAVAARRFGGTSYAHLAGVGRRDPVLGVALVLGLLTLAGFPPAVIGLVAKYLVLQPVVVSGYAWLAGIMAVNVALGLVYYLRLVVVAYAPADRVTAGDGAPVTSVREGRGARLAYAVVVVGAVALAATSIAPSLLLGALP
ncbi:NADH-quinone oxidoreductase subunit N [Mumia zhuanghuii]|uniref:NADH-quinone oxidoreductase subunit N n=1 Tax=Mumia zhuanghuii TaxID=2585211 RepID=A0A5C4MK73_9ACTN|nr:proton-conducting transporter membrane subunit [Mumia zhuanghuii]TNC24750.1 NADH-quinone oxidoreductase subunit N [Mumia zhuanghuii]TNC45185.1 NADH-quinone oxidoreductase subunit N [Mumia zhuanghuii]